MDRNADGFIMRDGEFISLDDVERMFSAASEFLDSPSKVAGMMIDLALDCERKGRHGTAQAYLEKALGLFETDRERSSCLLGIGLTRENAGDFAVDLDNNTGYCLNELGRHGEAEGFCRKAIQIDPDRHNAHKNLGVALEGLGRHAEAAASFLAAAEMCPEDQRAFRLLEELSRSHPEIQGQVPDFRSRMDTCRTSTGASWN